MPREIFTWLNLRTIIWGVFHWGFAPLNSLKKTAKFTPLCPVEFREADILLRIQLG